jgi:polysaccharide export outer membrane protein
MRLHFQVAPGFNKFAMKKNAFIILGLFISFLTASIFTRSDSALAQSDKEYTISPNDVLAVTVYQEPDLCATLKVAQDGSINYPLLGKLKAAGLTERELEKVITDLLAKDYLVDPQVNLIVKEYAKVSLLGQVRTPGSYEMKESLTLTQAIALAGGYSEKADINKVKIIRTKGNKKETITVNISDIMNKESPDIMLEPNDVVLLEEYGQLSIIGQVKNPGSLVMKESLTLTQAVALAGGFSETANLGAVKIIRRTEGKKQTYEVNVRDILDGVIQDIELKADDTVIVEEENLGRISVMGQVVRPGIYNLKQGLTVVEAISLAGGFTSTAAMDGTRIIRTQQGQKAAIPIRISDIIKGGDKSKDIILQDGDTIVVPESFF